MTFLYDHLVSEVYKFCEIFLFKFYYKLLITKYLLFFQCHYVKSCFTNVIHDLIEVQVEYIYIHMIFVNKSQFIFQTCICEHIQNLQANVCMLVFKR